MSNRTKAADLNRHDIGKRVRVKGDEGVLVSVLHNQTRVALGLRPEGDGREWRKHCKPDDEVEFLDGNGWEQFFAFMSPEALQTYLRSWGKP